MYRASAKLKRPIQEKNPWLMQGGEKKTSEKKEHLGGGALTNFETAEKTTRQDKEVQARKSTTEEGMAYWKNKTGKRGVVND